MTDYSLEMFGHMFADDARHSAYAQALKQSIRPGDVVLDIGTGIGVYAMMAAKLGARRVYALEINPHVHLGRELADMNGLGDRIDFIAELSTDIELPERADVIVADLRGILPFYGQNLASIRDARARHLAPGGVLMPTRDRIFAALASNPTGVPSYRDIWLDNPFDVDLSRVIAEQANVMRQDRIRPEDLVSPPAEVAHIDYASDLTETGFAFEDVVVAERDGVVDGLSVWFEATVLDGLTYETGPHQPKTVYGMALFPFAEPVEVTAGTSVDVRFSAHPFEDDYVWKWGASATDLRGDAWAADQSSVRGIPIDPRVLGRRKSSHRVEGSAALHADQLILRMFGEGATLGEVAAALVATHPDVTATTQDALSRAADLGERYG